MTNPAKILAIVAIVLMANTIIACASSRQYTQTVYSVDDAGRVVATEVTKTRPAPKPLEGGDTSCTICGF